MPDQYLKDIQRFHPAATGYNFTDAGLLNVTMQRLKGTVDVHLGLQRYVLSSVEPGVSSAHRGDLFCTFVPLDQKRMDGEAAIREARAAAFEDAAAIIRMQYLHGGLSLMTEEECLKASYTFSNQAVLLRKNFQ